MATNVKLRKDSKKENKDRRPYAIARYIRITSDKVRSVLDLIRGKDYFMAIAILENCPKSAALPIKKALMSAGANAEVNSGLDKSNLYVAECFANAGPTLKRIVPRARGSADRILKRTSHIHVILDEKA